MNMDENETLSESPEKIVHLSSPPSINFEHLPKICTPQALSEIEKWVTCRPGLYRPQARDGGSSHGFCGAWCHRGAREEGRSYDLTIMTYYDQLCPIWCTQKFRISESTIEVLKELNL